MGGAACPLVAIAVFIAAAPPGGAQEGGRRILPLIDRTPRPLTPLERRERETGPSLPTLGPVTIPESRRSTLLPPAIAPIGPPGPRRPLRMGNFTLSPSAGLSTTYDDNINADRDDREDDVIIGLTGALRAQSILPRHSLGFRAEAGADLFVEDGDENSFDWLVGADGRLDLTPDSSLGADIGFTRYTESAESPEVTEETDESPTINLITGGAAYAAAVKRFGWQVASRISRLDAEDGATSEERDRISYDVSAEGSYLASRRLTVFAGPSYAFNDFDDDDAGVGDSQSVAGTTGVRLTLGRGVAATAEIGYLRVFFDDPERDDTGAVIGGIALEGAIPFGRQTTLRLGLDRSIDVASIEESSLRTTTAFSAGITEQLTSVSVASASITYAHRDFDDIERTDQDVIAALGYSHALTQNVALNLGYRFSKRFSDEDEEEFYRNTVTIGLSAAF